MYSADEKRTTWKYIAYFVNLVFVFSVLYSKVWFVILGQVVKGITSAIAKWQWMRSHRYGSGWFTFRQDFKFHNFLLSVLASFLCVLSWLARECEDNDKRGEVCNLVIFLNAALTATEEVIDLWNGL